MGPGGADARQCLPAARSAVAAGFPQTVSPGNVEALAGRRSADVSAAFALSTTLAQVEFDHAQRIRPGLQSASFVRWRERRNAPRRPTRKGEKTTRSQS